MVDYQTQPVQSPPDYKGPCPAVPQAANQHGEQQIDVGSGLAFSVAAKGGYIEVVAQPAGKADVPAIPKILEVGCQIRAVKIGRQAIAKQPAHT